MALLWQGMRTLDNCVNTGLGIAWMDAARAAQVRGVRRLYAHCHLYTTRFMQQLQLGCEPLNLCSCCRCCCSECPVLETLHYLTPCVCAHACAGDPIRLSDCTGSSNQRWFMDASSRLRPFHAPAKCMDIRNGALVAVGFPALDLAIVAALTQPHCMLRIAPVMIAPSDQRQQQCAVILVQQDAG